MTNIKLNNFLLRTGVPIKIINFKIEELEILFDFINKYDIIIVGSYIGNDAKNELKNFILNHGENKVSMTFDIFSNQPVTLYYTLHLYSNKSPCYMMTVNDLINKFDCY